MTSELQAQIEEQEKKIERLNAELYKAKQEGVSPDRLQTLYAQLSQEQTELSNLQLEQLRNRNKIND